jgi:hypothetical protein
MLSRRPNDPEADLAVTGDVTLELIFATAFNSHRRPTSAPRWAKALTRPAPAPRRTSQLALALGVL